MAERDHRPLRRANTVLENLDSLEGLYYTMDRNSAEKIKN